MINTSLGYHTFAFFQRAKEDEFLSLTTDFIAYANRNKEIKRFPIKNKRGWEYTYKNSKGIRWQLFSFRDKNGFSIQGVKAVINPRVLIEKNYIVASHEEDLKIVEKIYNSEAAKISPFLSPFGACSLCRADPCLNIDLEELGLPCTPEQMMDLIRQGNIPKHYEERKVKYDEKQHRKVADKNSLYLKSKSSTINYYWKYPKQNETHPHFLFRESSRNVIRLEVQCKYLKLYTLSKGIRCESKYHISDENISTEEAYERMIDGVRNPSIPIDLILSDKVCDDIVRRSIYKVLRKGDYFTLDGARSIVRSYNFRHDKEGRIIDALELVNECHGIAKAKSRLCDSDLKDFNRSLRDLDDIWVNPVTIPRRWEIRHIPNLLRAYDDASCEEQLLFEKEYVAWKHIDKYLSE